MTFGARCALCPHLIALHHEDYDHEYDMSYHTCGIPGCGCHLGELGPDEPPTHRGQMTFMGSMSADAWRGEIPPSETVDAADVNWPNAGQLRAQQSAEDPES